MITEMLLSEHNVFLSERIPRGPRHPKTTPVGITLRPMDPEMGIWVVSAWGARWGRDTRCHQLPKEACLGTVEQGAAAQSINERTHGNSVASLPRADAVFTQRNCMLHKCYT